MPDNLIHHNMIHYESFESPLGDMIAGATGRGVCFLEWHDRGGMDKILARIEKRYKTLPIHKTGNRFASSVHPHPTVRDKLVSAEFEPYDVVLVNGE